eukprot:COSAG01_NODE_2089_length_8454_cov_12.054339_16_plen_202_part_00
MPWQELAEESSDEEFFDAQEHELEELPAADAATTAAIRVLRAAVPAAAHPRAYTSQEQLFEARRQLAAGISAAAAAEEARREALLVELKARYAAAQEARRQETEAAARSLDCSHGGPRELSHAAGEAEAEPADLEWFDACSSPVGDEPSPPSKVRLRRFEIMECLWSSGDTTIIDRDKTKGKLNYPHTHTRKARPPSGKFS